MKSRNQRIEDIKKVFKLRSEGLSLHEVAVKTNLTAEGVRKTINTIIKIVEDYKKI